MHRAFYHGITGYLRPNGSVILVENSEGSSPEDFIPMITEPGLRFKGTIKPSLDDAIYALKVLTKNYANNLIQRHSSNNHLIFLNAGHCSMFV